MELKELIERSGDSQLQSCLFEDGELSFTLLIDEFDARVDFTVPTDAVRAPRIEPGNAALRTCFIELVDLAEALTVGNGVYVPAEEFGAMMREIKRGLNLAYGRRRSEAGWLLNLVGSEPLLSCLVSDPARITWESNLQ